MRKLGKETEFLIWGITAVFVISFMAVWVSAHYLAKEYRAELVSHDYAVAGRLLNHPGDLTVAAFTACPNAADQARGRDALSEIGYSDTTSIRLLPSVLAFRNKVMTIFFCLLLVMSGSLYLILFLYLHRQRRIIQNAETSIRGFLDGNVTCPIACEESGVLHSLFHEINELSSILSAHVDNEKRTKEFLQDIISDVSHQLKTPLSALRMYCEIIGSPATDRDHVNQFSEKSLGEIRRVEDVVHTLLKLARLDAGIIQMQKAQENISLLMQDIVERFEIWAARDGKTITLSGKDNISLYCDALWLSEAVGNMIKNALEHTEKNGHIAIRWEKTPVFTQIIIEDDGTGIHPEDLYNIFKRFYRSRYSQDIHGTGLGLPLAKSIVEAHGGTISVTDRPDGGTIFTLNFSNLTNK